MKDINEVYSERNTCVSLIAKMALTLGFRVTLERDINESQWWIVYIQLPNGQVSWHFHQNQMEWFEGFPINTGSSVYDQHSDALKYQRVLSWVDSNPVTLDKIKTITDSFKQPESKSFSGSGRDINSTELMKFIEQCEKIDIGAGIIIVKYTQGWTVVTDTGTDLFKTFSAAMDYALDVKFLLQQIASINEIIRYSVKKPEFLREHPWLFKENEDGK